MGRKLQCQCAMGGVPPLLKPADSESYLPKDFVSWDEKSTTESKDEQLIHVLS